MSGFHSNYTYYGDLIHKGHQLHAEGYQQGPGCHLAQAPPPTRLVSSQQCGQTPAVVGEKRKNPNVHRQAGSESFIILFMYEIHFLTLAEVSVNGIVDENWQKCVG